MTVLLIAAAVLLIISMLELSDHNKKVEQTFSEYTSQHADMRNTFTVHFTGFILVLIILIVCIVKSF